MSKHRFGGVIGGNMSAIKTGVKIIDDFHVEITLSNGAVYEMHAPKGQSLNGLSRAKTIFSTMLRNSTFTVIRLLSVVSAVRKQATRKL